MIIKLNITFFQIIGSQSDGKQDKTKKKSNWKNRDTKLNKNTINQTTIEFFKGNKTKLSFQINFMHQCPQKSNQNYNEVITVESC